jgi:hypothetical protein
MKPVVCRTSLLVITLTTLLAVSGFAAGNPFLGGWDLTIPGGGAGWLGVTQKGDALEASLLWGGGSVVPLASAKVENDKLILTRVQGVQRKDASGATIKQKITETITGTISGNEIHLVTVKPKANGAGDDRAEFAGKRTPPLPPAPDLAKVRFGDPIQLFNGKDLTGWRLLSPGSVNAWSAKDGVLANNAAQEEGKPHKNYGNLRTDREFEDFNLKLEFRVPKGGNSGIYLRGIYEVQVADSFGQAPESHRVGAIYSRITPTENPAKPAGEWQSIDITLVDRHVTVILNGKKIIDNQPIEGCTGGAMWSDGSRPGPLYLQGDHTSVEYRNMTLRPVLKP